LTQPSKRFDIWRRLYTRFLIEPFPAEGASPAVSTLVTPITDADELLLDRGVNRKTEIVSATGEVDIFTVAEDKRDNIIAIWLFQATGTFTFNAIIVKDAPSSANNMRIDSFTTTSERIFLPPAGFKMDSGWQLTVNVDVHSGAGNLFTAVMVEEEDAF